MSNIINGNQTLEKLSSGATKLCDCVKLTLGPKGRNVAIERKFTYPLITNDGVTIAKEVSLDDKFENIGASVIKQASIKTNEMAGDGTTTACILATNILTEGIKNIVSGANSMVLRRGINKATQVVKQHLHDISKKVDSIDDIMSIASISAGSKEIGQIITEAFKLVGKDGVITVDEGKTCKTELKITKGMQIDKGFVSPYMITNTDKLTANLISPLVLVTDQKISNINQIIHILEAISSSGKSLLIIADDYDAEVINTLIVNKLRGNLNVVCVKSPAFADKKQAILMDICAITHAKLISQSLGLALNECTIESLGECASVLVSATHTTITGGKGDQQEIDSRIQSIRSQIEMCDNDFDKEELRIRLAKLTNGIAQILVGSNTEIEMQELKLRIEDAIEATKSAVELGVVPGGGIALVSAIPKLHKYVDTLEGDERTGAQIVLRAISAPLKVIADNAGVSGDVVLDKVLQLQSKDCLMGYDANLDKYVNMLDCGIVDPTKVTLCALENAVSVSATLLTTECIITAQDK